MTCSQRSALIKSSSVKISDQGTFHGNESPGARNVHDCLVVGDKGNCADGQTNYIILTMEMLFYSLCFVSLV